MKLYERDYSVISAEEEQQEKEIRHEHTSYLGKLKVYNSRMYREFPRAIRHFRSLFPNNFLDIVDLDNVENLHLLNNSFKTLMETNTVTESDIQKYIKDSKAYHIIGSLLKGITLDIMLLICFQNFSLVIHFKWITY